MSNGKRFCFAVGTGVVLGLFLRYIGSAPLLSVANTLLSLAAGVYLGLLQMLVVPLIFFSIIHSMLHFRTVADNQAMVRISLRAVCFLLVMTSISCGIAMFLAMTWQVGLGLQWTNVTYSPPHAYTNLVDSLLGLLPSHPLQAMVDENTVAIAIFAILIGAAALILHKTHAVIVDDFHRIIVSIFAVIKQMTRFIISLTPYGVFALIAQFIVSNGWMALSALSHYVAVIFIAMLCVISLHTLINWMVRGYSPWAYFRRAYPALLIAFTTRSSFGTLPVTEETLAQKFKLNQLTASFVPSIGATLGMNACAGIFPGMVIAMTMMALGQPITGIVIAKVMLVSAITSLGVSGIPGTAFVAASAALNLLGLPYFMLGVVQSVDPLVDMGRTATNVNGAITAALIAEKTYTPEEKKPAEEKREIFLD